MNRVGEMQFAWIHTECGMTPPVLCVLCGARMVRTSAPSRMGMELYACPVCPETEDNDEVLIAFAVDMLKWLRANTEDFYGAEWSEDTAPILQKHGFAERAVYDPDKHGDIPDADPGDEVWVWTERMKSVTGT